MSGPISETQAPLNATDLLPLLREGITHHRAGKLAEAERCYARVLEGDPEQAEALHHLGLVRHQQGDSQQGAKLVRRFRLFDPRKSHEFYRISKQCVEPKFH